MSDNIDIPVTSSGADGIERIVSAIDRLHAAMTNLGNNSAVSRLEDQMKVMQASITAGFAGMAKETISGGNAVVAAKKKTEDELATVNEKARDRQLNADRTFLQAKQGMADKQLDVDVKFAQATAKVDAARAAQKVLDYDKELQVEQRWLTMLEQAREKAVAGEALFNRTQAKLAADRVAAQVLDYAREEEIAAKWIAMLEAQREKGIAGEVLFNRTQAKIASERVAAQVLDYAREEELAVKWELMLQATREKELAGEALFNRTQAKLAADRVAAQVLDYAREEELAVKWEAMLHNIREKELSDEALFNRTQAKLAAERLAAQQAADAKTAATQAKAAERQRVLNSTFLAAPAGTQLRIAERAAAYQQQPGASLGGAINRFGTSALTADLDGLRAQAAAAEALRRSMNGVGGAAGEAARGTAQHNAMMREGHSLARGLAGSLGGLWLTYGSIVPLAAGAAIAASLKNVVTVGKEVENQLNFVRALSDKGQGVDLNKFLTITDSSLSSVVESANAMRMLAQNGLNAVESLRVLPSVLDLALVGEMDVGQAALAVTGAVSAFGLGIGEAGRVADIFARTAANSNTSVIAITESMKQASTSASLFKVTIEETAGVLGTLAKINITGGAAGTAMTNMLTGLYEPTEKGKKAMRELGLETKTASGALKPFTEVMEEMRMKLASFNDSAKVDLLGSIFTARGVKAVMQVQENLSDYQKKVQEATTATGFMRGVVEKLEDSTHGAFTRLGVTVQNSLVRAFSEANPYVQQIGLTLNAAFAKGSAADTGLGNFATNIARLTGALIENAGIVTGGIAGYIGLRMAYTALAPVVGAAITATNLSTAATAAAATANAVHATAMSAGAATTLTLAAATEASTAATVAATAATAAWEAVLLPALAAVAIAVAAGAALWLLFRDNTTEADKANVKMSNSMHVIEEALRKEEERLTNVIRLWDARNMRFNSDGEVGKGTLDEAKSTVLTVEDKIRKEGKNPDEIRKGGYATTETRYNPQTGDFEQIATAASRYAAELSKADENLKGLQKTQNEFETSTKPKQEFVKVISAQNQLREDLEKLVKQSEEKNSKGEFYQQNEAIRAKQAQAADILKQLKSGGVSLEGKDPTKVKPEVLAAESARIEKLRTDYKMLNDEINKMQGGRAVKPENENAALQAKLKALDLELQLERIQQGAAVRAAKGEHSRGEIGDLQLINRELAAKVALEDKAVSVAKRQYELADAANKPAKKQEYLNRETLAVATKKDAGEEADEKRRNALDRMAQESVEAEAKALADKGQLVDAYMLEYEAKYGKVLKRLRSDAAAEKNPEDKATIEAYIAMLEKRGVEGKRQAGGKELSNQFQAGLSSLDQMLARLKNDADGSSIGQMFMDALAAEKALEAALPGLIAKQKEMADAAVTPSENEAAAKALKDIDDRAARTRQVWVNVGKAIEKSLGDAFGKGGKAIGQMVTIYGGFSAKQKEIQANLKRDSIGKSDEDRVKLQKKANEDMVQNQLRSYGDMAGAAKGFFSENSKGYEALTKIQNIFRAFEMAMALKSMATQLMATTTVTAAKVTGTTLEKAAVVSTVPVTLAAEGTKQTAYGVSALASALTAPFPMNIAAFAAVAAMLAAIGVAVSGGGSGKSISEERQEKQGTGSVLGSPKAKSESISRALDRIESNTYQGLSVSMSMLNALRGIQSSIGNFASLIVRNSGLTGEGYESMNTKAYRNPMLGFGGSKNAGLNMGVGLLAMGPIGLALGALMSTKIGEKVGQFLGRVFGGSKSVEDTGFGMSKDSIGNIRNRGVSGWQYADIKKDGGWFRSDKYSTQWDSLGADANRQFGQVINSMADTIMTAGTMLGVSGADLERRLNSFVVDIGKISLKGKSGDEIQKELEAVFSKLGDDMATWSVQGMEKFAKIGEGPLETLTRMAQEYATIDVVFASFGKTFGQVGTASLEARARLIELSGGLEEFISQGEYFLQNFYTEAEQREKLRARIQPTLSQYGLNASAPDAMMQLRRFVESLDVTTQYGAQAYAALMQVAPALKDVADAANEVADEAKDLRDEIDELMMSRAELLAKERNSLDAANRALFDQLQAAKAVAEARDRIKEAYENEKTTIESTIERIKGLAQSWKEFRDNLIMGDKSTLTPEQKYAAAQAKYEETLAAARAGDTKAQDAFQSVAEAFLDASRVSNASGAGYTRDFEGVLQATKDNEAWAQREVDLAKANLDALKTQVEHLVSIDEKIGTVAQELAGYAAAHAEYLARQAAAAAPPPGTQTSTTGVYYEREGKSDALVGIVIDTVSQGLQMLREQQAQETQDAINSNAAEIRRASEEQAEALRERNLNRKWQDRYEVYER